MTQKPSPSPDATPIPAPAIGPDLGGALMRAFTRASVWVLGLGAVVGGVVFGLALLPNESLPFYCAGLAAALVAGLAALLVHGRLLDPKATAPFARDGRLLAQKLQSLLAAAFGAKLAILLLAFFVLRALGVKFADTATFAVTFAGGALLCQMATAMSLARSAGSAMQPRTTSPGLTAGAKASGGNVS